jgi:hypothetical protein
VTALPAAPPNDETENHDEVETVFERPYKTVQGSGSISKGGTRARPNQQGNNQSFPPPNAGTQLL